MKFDFKSLSPLQITAFVMAVALLLCLFHMPYGYYTLCRWAAMLVFAIFAYNMWRTGNQTLAIVFGALVLLFQPFLKFALGRPYWQFIDVAAAVFLVIIAMVKKLK